MLDGEVVVNNAEGKPEFNALQNYRVGDPILYYIFDIIWLDGRDLTQIPLIQRKEILQDIIPARTILKYSEHFEDGKALFEQVKLMGLEGIVAKKKDSCYVPGKKTNSWLKIKAQLRREYIIGGWTESESGRLFKSLLLGYYVNGELIYIHHCGHGFDDKEVEVETKAHWTTPVTVAEFKQSTNKTKAGKIRHPVIYLGIRQDKDPLDVVEESPEPIGNKTKTKAKKTK